MKKYTESDIAEYTEKLIERVIVKARETGEACDAIHAVVDACDVVQVAELAHRLAVSVDADEQAEAFGSIDDLGGLPENCRSVDQFFRVMAFCILENRINERIPEIEEAAGLAEVYIY